MLGVLTQQWAPQAMIISFKLETDQSILIYKVCAPLVGAVQNQQRLQSIAMVKGKQCCQEGMTCTTH